MKKTLDPARWLLLAPLALGAAACREDANTASDDTTSSVSSTTSSMSTSSAGGSGGGGAASTTASSSSSAGGGMPCGTPAECAAAMAEQKTADHYDAIHSDPTALATFLTAMPKGGDLHNHLTGAVYAETYLALAKADGDCINPTTHQVVFPSSCSATNQPVPSPGAFYDEIVRAWSMKDFVSGGAESGHDHFFATFGKYGAVAGAHRNESLADIATRAATENQSYIETMFNMAKNVADITDNWSGPVTDMDLAAMYAQTIADPGFATAVAQDVAVVNGAYTQYRSVLGCSGASPPPACDVTVRFVAQVARTGAKDTVFGQLIGAYEMAAKTPYIVAANLSSPEDDPTSISNYGLHMKMLEFLRNEYASRQLSPLRITLHAGELTPAYLPPGSTANTFHIRDAVEIGGAQRIGHGLDVLSETNPQGLLSEMSALDVLVEICMSSNAQILEVSGPAHPLSAYLQAGVPVSLATDDQGVSRSSLAGEFFLAATDQGLDYKTLKRMARNSLEHAFLPGASLWTNIATADPVNDCEPALTGGVGGTPDAACQAFLDGSERAALQWDLEARFRVFEAAQ